MKSHSLSRRCAALLVLVTAVLAGCGGGGGGSDSPPSSASSSTDTGAGTGTGGSGSSSSSGGTPTSNVTLSATATDADGDTLTYAWRVSDGTIAGAGTAAPTWTLPAGKGIHFAYVQVSDGKGGYTERQVALSTDDFGTVASVPAAKSPFTPPAATLSAAGAPRRGLFGYRSNNLSPTSDARQILIPDVPIIAQGAPGSPQSITDVFGEFLFVGLPTGNYTAGCGGAFGLSCVESGAQPLDVGAEAYFDRLAFVYKPPSGSTVVFGHVTMADGTLCGTRNKFFETEVSATASLPFSNSALISGRLYPSSTRINAYGDFLLTVPSASLPASVTIRCENAAIVSVPINAAARKTNQTGDQEIDLGVITVPNRAPQVTAVTATRATAAVALDLKAADPVVAPKALPQAVLLSPTISFAALLGTPPEPPSSAMPAPDAFLTAKGLDDKVGACQYYRAIGAVDSCDASGNPANAITFDDWKRINALAPYDSARAETTATYINKVDLNLVRRQHGTYAGPQAAPTRVAIVVCNYKGPQYADPRVEDQATVDAAIDAALADRNLIACVAMDYSATPGVNGGLPFTRFYTFGPDGRLLLSVNLDGRREKFMPGVCAACHGGDRYTGRFVTGQSGAFGGHFLPFDTENYKFSSKATLGLADQAAAIKELNRLVSVTDATAATKTMIAAWYPSGPIVPVSPWVPPTWATAAAADPSGNTRNLYTKVIAPACRTCHIALKSSLDFNVYSNIDDISALTLPRSVCGGHMSIHRNHTMPNSLVTFDRFWRSWGSTAADRPDQPKALGDYLGGDGCKLTEDPRYPKR